MPAGYWEAEVYRLSAEMSGLRLERDQLAKELYEVKARTAFDPTELSDGELIQCLEEMRARDRAALDIHKRGDA